jgi:hypothetical protein
MFSMVSLTIQQKRFVFWGGRMWIKFYLISIVFLTNALKKNSYKRFLTGFLLRIRAIMLNRQELYTPARPWNAFVAGTIGRHDLAADCFLRLGVVGSALVVGW